jgi:hypothetical protein
MGQVIDGFFPLAAADAIRNYGDESDLRLSGVEGCAQ